MFGSKMTASRKLFDICVKNTAITTDFHIIRHWAAVYKLAEAARYTRLQSNTSLFWPFHADIRFDRLQRDDIYDARRPV